MKKEILISMFDMEIGGIERSLINMLESFDYDRCNVSLLVCSHQGDFMSLIPPKVNVLPEIGAYTVFRKSLKQCIREGHYRTSLNRIRAKLIARRKARQWNFSEGPGYIQMQLEAKYASRILPELQHEYDLAISYAWPHNIIAAKVRAKHKVAWIHTDYSKLEIDNSLDLEGWSQYDQIASISEACTESFLLKYPSLKDKIIPIENITSPAFVQALADEQVDTEMAQSDFFHLVSVGRLSHVKGFDMAIKALKLLHNKGLTNIKWHVVGYGGNEAELRLLIAEYKLEDSFLLRGKKTNPYPFIKQCDVYVQPSRYEGKAVTVTEAQILGKPVIITNYPTSSSQVTHGKDGIICDISPEGIADAIEQLYKDQELRDRLAGYVKAQNYSNSSELDKLYDMMRS